MNLMKRNKYIKVNTGRMDIALNTPEKENKCERNVRYTRKLYSISYIFGNIIA